MASARAARVILVGTAFAPEVPLAHPRVSAAAAAWQLDFARALAARWATDVTCVSYLPLGRDETAPAPMRVQPGIDVVPVARRFPGGAPRYALAMTRAALGQSPPIACVFAYNPLPWTVPFARAIATRARAPLVLIVADLRLRGDHPMRLATEAAMLRLARRFVVLSPGALPRLPRGARATVFAGLADAAALARPLPPIPSPRRFLYAGSRSPYEGFTAFVAAAERIAESDESCEFHVTGRGAPAQISPRLAARWFDHGFVSRDALDRLLAAGAIAVNPRPPSMSPFNAPHKLLFYLSSGLPTISTRTPGVGDELADVVLDAEASPDGLVAAMQRALAMAPGELTALATRGRRRVTEVMAPERLVERLKRDLGLAAPQAARPGPGFAVD